jgi:alpha-tubulin suppressor-like RCC1 family protein
MDSSSLFPLVRSQIACGLKHTMAVSDAGTMYAWGGGESNQLGNDRLKNIALPIELSESQPPESENENEVGLDRMCAKRLVQISTGSFHTAALRADGYVYTWGWNENGCLGCPDLKNPTTGAMRVEGRPLLIYFFKNMNIRVVHVSCGSNHTVATDSNGDCYSWGLGNYGNLGHGDTHNVNRPKLIDTLKGKMVKMAGCGSKHTLVCTSKGDLYTFGHGDNGRLGNNERRGCLIPELVEGRMQATFVIYCAAGEAHSAVIDDNGVLFTFGAGSYGRLGLGEESDALTPTPVDTLRKYKIVMVSCGAFHTMCVTKEKELWGFGGRLYGKLGDGIFTGNAMTPIKVAPEAGDGSDPSGFTQIACGTFHSAALTAAGHIKTFGFDGQGQLGIKDNDFKNQSEPQVVHNLDTVQITGMSHLLAEEDAKRQQLKGKAGTSTPAKSKGSSGLHDMGGGKGGLNNAASSIVSISAGAQHSLACTLKGDVYAWGENRDGQLGLNSNISQLRPVRVEYHISGKRIRKVAAGAQHSLCLTVRGDVYAWGQGKDGQLGLGKNASESRPMLIQVLQGKIVTDIAAGENHSGAVLRDGVVFTWGSGDMGKLGHGRVTRPQILPRTVRGALKKETCISLSLGMSHSAAVTKNGQVYIWGGGWFGRLGLGNSDNIYTPCKIESLDYMFIVQIACGGYHTMALTSEGEVYIWGRGDERLGLGETPDVLDPTLVTALRQKQANIVSITAGEEHSCAVADTGMVYAWGKGRYGKLGLAKGANEADADDSHNLPRDVLCQRGTVTQPLRLLRPGADETDIRCISTYSNHTLSLAQDGTVYAWGNKGGGRLGLNPPMSEEYAACGHEVTDLSAESSHEDGKQRTSSGNTSASGQTKEGSRAGAGGAGDVGGGVGTGTMEGRGGQGGNGDDGSEATIEYHMSQYTLNRVNPPCQFVQLILETEPSDHHVEQIKMVETNLSRKEALINRMYIDIHREEEVIRELQNTIRLTIKSTLNEGAPMGLDIHDFSTGIPYEIKQDHSVYTELFRLLLLNPMYLVEMYHFFIQETPANKASCGGQFCKFFSDLVINVYGDFNRSRNDHLFISYAKQIMVKDITAIQSKSSDLSEFAAHFPDAANVFGMTIKHYFTLNKNVRTLQSRFGDLLTELMGEDLNFQYDPLLVQVELRGGGGAAELKGDGSLLDQRRTNTYNTKTAIRNKVNERVDSLNEVMLKWAQAIMSSTQTLPEEIRWLCRELHQSLITAYGLESNSAENFKFIVASFLYNNYFRPVIMHPEQYGLMSVAKGKMTEKTRGNLRFIAMIVEKSLSQSLFPVEIKWLHSSNQKIQAQKQNAIKWVDELTAPALHLPSQMVIDVYQEHLQGTVRIVHTVPLMCVELLRWMLYTAGLKNQPLGLKAKDPIDNCIKQLFGPGRDDNRNKVNTWMDSGWLTCKSYGINYELDTTFFAIMDVTKLVRENRTQVPLPRYLAPDDAAPLKSSSDLEYGIDQRKLQLQELIRAGVQVPPDSQADQMGSFISNVAKQQAIATKQKDYDLQQMAEQARVLLEEMSLQGTPLSEVMGELMTLVHARASRNKQLRRDHTNLERLLLEINAYRGKLESKRESLSTYLDLLQRGISDTQNRQQVAIIIKKKKNLGHLTSSTLVQDSHAHVKPTKLKMLLAKHKQVRGTHGVFTYKELTEGMEKVITNFTLSDELSAKELKETKSRLTYHFSSTAAGVFVVTTVFDHDMVLDHFEVSAEELLVCKRQLVKEWSSSQAGGASKTTFNVFGLLRKLQQLTMKQIMLGQTLEHSKNELTVVKDVM